MSTNQETYSTVTFNPVTRCNQPDTMLDPVRDKPCGRVRCYQNLRSGEGSRFERKVRETAQG